MVPLGDQASSFGESHNYLSGWKSLTSFIFFVSKEHVIELGAPDYKVWWGGRING